MVQRLVGIAVVSVSLIGGSAIGLVIDLEELVLPQEAYWNGSDQGKGFYSAGAWFNNTYTQWPGGIVSWDGFAYSNRTDRDTQGLDGQYCAIPGAGQGRSRVYAIGFVGWDNRPVISFQGKVRPKGLYATNVSYTYYAMLNGNPFCKRFGGPNGTDPDWLILTITGLDEHGNKTGQIHFYLADLRDPDPAKDYILSEWAWVDLTDLGQVSRLEFGMSSSDTGPFGMNTPAYFALDSIVLEGVLPMDTAVAGYVDRLTHQPVDPNAKDAIPNPIFSGWATGITQYRPSNDKWITPGLFDNPLKALGPATGDPFDIVSLGELDLDQIAAQKAPGSITLTFAPLKISDGPGLDFVVFENGIATDDGKVFAELAFVEVSTNGNDFARFPSLALNPTPIGPYGLIEIGSVHNLAGRYPNAYGRCLGTGFDLQDLLDHPLVAAGVVDLNDIRYVRIVDIPGDGAWSDQATAYLGPNWTCYSQDNPIYDPWPTWGSGGFDLEAIGILKPQYLRADINLDGKVDMMDMAILTGCWQTRYGQQLYNARADLNRDLKIDQRDLDILSQQWLMCQPWHQGN